MAQRTVGFLLLVSVSVLVSSGLTACGSSGGLSRADGATSGSDGGGTDTDGGSGAGDTVTLTTTPFPVAPNQEIYKCQDYANPFGGADVDIREFDSHMTVGSHHMLLFYQNTPMARDLYDCAGLQFSPTPFGAQQPETTIAYPDGVGALIKGSQGFHMQMHYLNSSPQTIMAQVTIVFHKAKPGSVTQHAGVFFFNNISGEMIPPNTTKTITATCPMPVGVNVLYALSHMHRRSTNLTATVNGQTLYTSNSWDNAQFQLLQPVVPLAAGTPVTWSCTQVNDTNNVLTFGESALTNEMCIFEGQYYPVADPANPTIECMR